MGRGVSLSWLAGGSKVVVLGFVPHPNLVSTFVQKGLFLNHCYVAYCLRTSRIELFGAHKRQRIVLKAANLLILDDEPPPPTLNCRVFAPPIRASAISNASGELQRSGG
jgi:hypothetical protein